MSGLLRRIKRSRAAEAGEAPADGQAAAPEDARMTAETAAAAGATPRGAEPARSGPPAAPGAPPSGAAREGSGDPAKAAPPAIVADPELPAGVDPAEAAVQPPKGRRGRLRRRLRYLRRARELMLRDLGGLLYEIHRTGGGDVSAHSTVIGAKVQRLANLDAETGAIETALASPRGDAVVFQPGVGGTCNACGELYGSAARFCSNCGAPTGADVRVAGTEPARRVPPMPTAPAKAEAAEAPTEVEAPADPATRREPPADPPADRPASEAPTRVDEPTQTDAAPDSSPSHNPFARRDNGRAQDDAAPDRNPLARESRS
jgi:hypothetical protein